ncbi:hypothetical protein GX50_07455 [[Emmonsia] crescens]|uniref:Uncharacterized protein n=1 Tax=[Emmonsia] crescens TaxID=73230 RepID=A0A2B7Z0A1_9EURO|nr:hypothetical protein GX50_07455 [Emmonsia crescens]
MKFRLCMDRIWVRASQVYRLSISALATSGIIVNSLAVYGNTVPCSVPSCDIMTLMEKLDWRNDARLGDSIQNLALSVSMKVETDVSKIPAAHKHLEPANLRSQMIFDWNMLKVTDFEAVAMIKFTGITHLLKLMLSLETIDLHLYYCLKSYLNRSLLQFLINYSHIDYLDLREIHLISEF